MITDMQNSRLSTDVPASRDEWAEESSPSERPREAMPSDTPRNRFAKACSSSLNDSRSTHGTSRFLELSSEVTSFREVRRTSSEKEHKSGEMSRAVQRLRMCHGPASPPSRKGSIPTDTLSSTQSLSPFGRERLRELAHRHAQVTPLSPVSWDDSLLASPCPSPLRASERPNPLLLRGGWVDPNELVIDLDETKRRHQLRRGYLSGTSTPSSEGGSAISGTVSPVPGSPQTKVVQRALRSQRLKALLREIEAKQH